MQLKNQLLGCALCLLTFGCVDISNLGDADFPDYQAEFAVPLINSRLTMSDILKDDKSGNSLAIKSDGTIQFVYRGNVLNRQSSEILTPFQASFPPFIPIDSKNQRLQLDLINGLDLDLITIKAGTFAYYLDNANDQPMQVDFEFTSLKDATGTPLRFSVNLAADDGSETRPFASNQTDPIDLTGYQIIPEDNEIALQYTAQTPDGTPVNASNFLISLNDLDFSYVEGYLGVLSFPGGEDTVDIDFFEDYTAGEIYFAEPEVTFSIENSFGVPTRALVNSFFIETLNGDQLPVASPLVDTGVDFPFPTLNQAGQVLVDKIVVNNSNSNVDTLLSVNPVRVIYDVDATINPEEDASIAGFITDSSYFNVQMEVVLPLYGRASGFRSTDTLDFTLGDTQGINSAEFKIITENELGVDISIQAYFLDDQQNVIDSLFAGSSPIIKGAMVDAAGVPTETVSVTTFVDFDQASIERIENAPLMILEVRFSTDTNGQEFVRIQNTQGVNIRMGAILGVSKE